MATVKSGKIVTAAFIPGATTKNDSIDLPAGYPEIGEILGGEALLFTAGTPDTFTAQALAPEVYDGSPTANYIQKKDGNTVVIGQDTITSDLLVVVYTAM